MAVFNEPELCLLREWENVRLIEESIKRVRQKYSAIFEKVLDRVQDNHRELDARKIQFTNDGLNVGIGKKSWPSKPGYYMSGLWISEVRIEDLTSEDQDQAHKTALINRPDAVIDLEDAREKLQKAAKAIFGKEEFRRADFDWGTDSAGVTLPILRPRSELRDLLLKDSERGFVSCMVDHFESMTKFIKVVDEIYNSAKRGRKS